MFDERDADKAAVECGLRKAFCIQKELPDPFRRLLDRLDCAEASEDRRDDRKGEKAA